MIRRIAAPLLAVSIAALALAAPAGAIGPPCAESPKTKCFGVESLDASLSTTQAGAHPDITYSFDIAQDPDSKTDKKGLHNVYAPTRNVRFEAPPGLIGDPSVLGVPQQCTALELQAEDCPNGSQIGTAIVNAYSYGIFKEPVYMMAPPGGDVIARVGLIAAIIPVYADVTLRSESDYGLSIAITDAAAEANLVKVGATLWGVPSDPSHDKERCTPNEAFEGCEESPSRPPRLAGAAVPHQSDPLRRAALG